MVSSRTSVTPRSRSGQFLLTAALCLAVLLAGCRNTAKSPASTGEGAASAGTASTAGTTLADGEGEDAPSDQGVHLQATGTAPTGTAPTAGTTPTDGEEEGAPSDQGFHLRATGTAPAKPELEETPLPTKSLGQAPEPDYSKLTSPLNFYTPYLDGETCAFSIFTLLPQSRDPQEFLYYGLEAEDGSIRIEPKYTSLQALSHTRIEARFPKPGAGKTDPYWCGILDDQGREVLPFAFRNLLFTLNSEGRFHAGVAVSAEEGGKSWLIDIDGNQLSPYGWDTLVNNQSAGTFTGVSGCWVCTLSEDGEILETKCNNCMTILCRPGTPQTERFLLYDSELIDTIAGTLDAMIQTAEQVPSSQRDGKRIFQFHYSNGADLSYNYTLYSDWKILHSSGGNAAMYQLGENPAAVIGGLLMDNPDKLVLPDAS